jgi:hyperosmotically inducible protein
MKLTKVLMTAVIAASLFFTGCKPKDEDIKAKVEETLKADGMMTGSTVDVKEGVVTLGGICKDDSCKAMCQKKVEGIKGVKSVVNNCTVTPPPAPPVAAPASVTTMLDEATQQKVKDGLKDIKGVTVTFEGEKAVLAGEVSKADNMKIMQMLGAAKVKSDASKLTVKK